MRFNILSAVVTIALFPSAFSYVVHGAAPLDSCHSPTIVSENYFGESNDVKFQVIQCANSHEAQDATELVKDQANICGAQCTTNCFPGAGGGPDPNECHVIADALRYDSQNIGAQFNLSATTNTAVITMQYKSCSSFIVNQANTLLTYCRTDWADVIDFVAPNCQATQNAHGGNCVAADKRWFIQVQHV